MKRIWISAILLLFSARGIAGPTPAPVISLSFYAPVQNDSPVRIIGFESDGSELRFVLSNLSEETVASVIIGNAAVPCETSPGEYAEWAEDYPRYRVLIAPHATIVLTPDINKNNYPWLLVAEAKHFGTQYIQQQFGIAGVSFQDGTVWPMPFDRVSRGATFGDAPFDRELLKLTARTCSRDADVRAAWDQVDDGEIAFAHQAQQATEPDHDDNDHNAIPQLHFSCTLKGRKAICHMPLRKGQTAQQRAAETAQ